MKYKQLTQQERYTIATLKWCGVSIPDIARIVGRHRSTIWREFKRNATRHDGHYRAQKAQFYTNARRRNSRRNRHFYEEQWQIVAQMLRLKISPEQISGYLRRHDVLNISYQTIYRYVSEDRARRGSLYKHLRHGLKQRRKIYRSTDFRGRMQGKRLIDERPPGAHNRSRTGHWEIDTVIGRHGTKPCILTMVERKTGYVLIGKLTARTSQQTNKRMIKLIATSGHDFKTITADNGTEFHSYKDVEDATGARFYFARPYHSWERGSNENTNGLIRQYLPKGTSMESLTQKRCDEIAAKLNNRPRKRYGYRTPAELLCGDPPPLHFK